MFYSHEVLTSRKYGVATIWLVATLGSQSTLRKVSRKAILDVNVPKACETIVAPEVPMALRLQSNLLYGVSRVYSQQCGYILADAQSTQNNMRALLKIIKTLALDPEAGRTRPGQLTLEDDPAFVPDLPLLPLHASFSNLALSSAPSSQYSSMLSPHTARSSLSSQSADRSVIGFTIPTSNTDGDAGDIGGFFLPGDDGHASGNRASKTGVEAAIYEDQEDGFFPEVDFEFDADGNIRDISAELRAAQTSGAAGGRRRLDGDSQASGRVRLEHDEGLLAGAEIGGALGGDFDMPMGDDFGILPDADPFPDMAALVAEARNIRDASSVAGKEAFQEGEESSESTEAPIRHRKKVPKIIPVDAGTMLRNSDLGQWNREYVKNMEEATKKKEGHRAPPLAKRNAALWVFGNGIGGIGQGVGVSKITNKAFENFSGQKLLASFSATLAEQTNKKRGRDTEEAEPIPDADGRRVRSRQDDDQIGRGDDMILDQDGMIPIFNNDGIEIGREAPPALPEFSSAMPWNTGSHAGSTTGRFYSSSMGGFPTSVAGPESSVQGSLPRRINRLTSASPLVGRGLRTSGGLERLSSLDIPDDEAAFLGRGSDDTGMGEVDKFELYGPSAGVDTQTAQQTQWMRDTLDRESYNFLDFLKVAVEGQEPREESPSGATAVSVSKFVVFEELLPPRENTKMVAAQGLIHALSLATKNLITIEQNEAYGEIRMSII